MNLLALILTALKLPPDPSPAVRVLSGFLGSGPHCE
jgi:hypothetical protein